MTSGDVLHSLFVLARKLTGRARRDAEAEALRRKWLAVEVAAVVRFPAEEYADLSTPDGLPLSVMFPSQLYALVARGRVLEASPSVTRTMREWGFDWSCLVGVGHVEAMRMEHDPDRPYLPPLLARFQASPCDASALRVRDAGGRSGELGGFLARKVRATGRQVDPWGRGE